MTGECCCHAEEMLIAITVFFAVFLLLWITAWMLLKVLTPENLLEMGRKYFERVLSGGLGGVTFVTFQMGGK